MGYYIDLSAITIDEYKKKLETGYLPPSRMMLKENLEEKFNYFKSIGIGNVQDLLQKLKKSKNITELACEGFFTEEYLKLLLRELNSILPRPNKIRDFLGISTDVVSKLDKLGIKNTAKLYDKILDGRSRKELAKNCQINESELVELTRLTDLSRIKWVGATFARMLYDLGIDSVEKAAHANAEELHEKINQQNKEKKYYKGQIGLSDIRIFVDAAKDVPVEVEY